MYRCACVCVCLCVSVCIRLCVSVCIGVHTFVCVCMYRRVYVCVCGELKTVITHLKRDIVKRSFPKIQCILFFIDCGMRIRWR